MERYLAALAVLVLAIGVAALLDRRRRRPALAPSVRDRMPSHLDRSDLPAATAEWAIVAFGSATCEACAAVREVVEPYDSDRISVVEVVWEDARDLHERYAIEAVPATLLVDAAGDVRRSWLGVIEPGRFRAEVSEVVDGGTAVDEPGRSS